MMRPLFRLNMGESLDVKEEGGEDELGQRLSVDATGGGHDHLALMQPHLVHFGPDPG